MSRFGTIVNCIDGRVQEHVSAWTRKQYLLDYTDVVTEPGPDRAITSGRPEQVQSIRSRIEVSIRAHRSNVIVIAGHEDCAGNPVEKAEHLRQIRAAVNVIRDWNLPVTIAGVWVDTQGTVEVVSI
jgi:hypothetical protein